MGDPGCSRRLFRCLLNQKAQRVDGFDRPMEAQAAASFLTDGVIRRLQQCGSRARALRASCNMPRARMAFRATPRRSGSTVSGSAQAGYRAAVALLRVSAAHLSQPPCGVVLRRNVVVLTEVGDHLRLAQRFHQHHSAGKSDAQLGSAGIEMLRQPIPSIVRWRRGRDLDPGLSVHLPRDETWLTSTVSFPFRCTMHRQPGSMAP